MAPRLPSFPRSAVVSFDYDVVTDTCTWFPPTPAVDGPVVADASLETFFVDIHDHDRESLRATLEVAVATGRPFACRYRVSRPGAPVASIPRRALEQVDFSRSRRGTSASSCGSAARPGLSRASGLHDSLP